MAGRRGTARDDDGSGAAGRRVLASWRVSASPTSSPGRRRGCPWPQPTPGTWIGWPPGCAPTTVDLIDVRELDEWALGPCAAARSTLPLHRLRDVACPGLPTMDGPRPWPARPGREPPLPPACCGAPAGAMWSASPDGGVPDLGARGSSSRSDLRLDPRPWPVPGRDALHPEDAVAHVGQRRVGRRRQARARARPACHAGRSRRRPRAGRSRSTAAPGARTAREARRPSPAARPRSSPSPPARRP